ncbi:MAG: hypothetical protein HQL37_15400, partial [Alphaproteobacteria bacterium]|nr:hypothetical protein [Alphaproteobacteria bacterium]
MMVLSRYFRFRSSEAVAALLLAIGLGIPLTATAKPPAPESASFSEDVMPILQVRCLECHKPGAAGYEKSGLDLRTYEG